MSYLSTDFQPLYAAKGSPRCQGRRRYISSNIGMQFKESGEWRHGNEYSTQTPKKSTLFSGQYLCNLSTLDIGVMGYIGIVWPKEHSPEVWSVPPVTLCISVPLILTLSNFRFFLHAIFLCFMWVLEPTATFPLYNHDWLILVTKLKCVCCAEGTECVTVNHVDFRLNWFSDLTQQLIKLNVTVIMLAIRLRFACLYALVHRCLS